MCGLAGIYAGSGDEASSRFLLTMAGELAHRGPDGTGLYLDERFGMVNRRLAIVDLQGGEQPLANEDESLWVMQNGEIYNHVELREELRGRGHRFSTSCDTEVLVHAYEEWGTGCLDHLNGDFAFAVWDRRARELLLARDRFGVRPLFLAEWGGALCFASEAKALLRHPRAARELDPAGLVESFTAWSLSTGGSAFRGVRELPPAHFLRWGPRGLVERRRWWDLDFSPRPGGERRDPGEAAEELRSLLDDSTRLRLRADVPVAAYLSGGLDSSAIAALARVHSRGGLRSFGVGFTDARYDESRFQRRMAEELGIELTQRTLDAGAIASLLPRAILLAEQPTLRTALAPMLGLSAAVREAGIKVVLTGEGADELFAGYDIFRESQIRRFWAREPDSRLRPALLRRLYPGLGRGSSRGGAYLESFFRRGLEDTGDPLYSHRIRFANTARSLRLFGDDFLARAPAETEVLETLAGQLPPRFAGFTGLGQAQYLETKTFLQGYLLHTQGDRMLMGHSVEGRFPFLDHRVAELAAALPDRLRLRGLRDKYLLRRATASLLPEEIRGRAKVPYRAPIAAALVGAGAPEYVADLLIGQRLAEAGIFSPGRVATLLEKCRGRLEEGVAEVDEMALVGVTSTMLLHEQLVARPALAAPAVATKLVRGDTVGAAVAAAG